MNFYDKHILPRPVHFVCGQQPVMGRRRRIAPLAEGRIFEIGLGSGLNLPLYDAGEVGVLVGLEPSAVMRRLAAAIVRIARSPSFCAAPASAWAA